MHRITPKLTFTINRKRITYISAGIQPAQLSSTRVCICVSVLERTCQNSALLRSPKETSCRPLTFILFLQTFSKGCGTCGPCLCVLGSTYCFTFGNATVAFLPWHSAACLQSSDVRQAVGFSPPFTLPVCGTSLSSFTETSQTAADTEASHLSAYLYSDFPSVSSPRCSGVTGLDGLFSSWLLFFQVTRTFAISL